MMLPPEPPQVEVRRPAPNRWRQAWRWITGLACLAFMLGAITLAWPQSLGGAFRTVVVSGKSMEPTFHTGDVLVAQRSASYQPGDIVVYSAHIDGVAIGRVVHRVVDVQADGTYVTKGDNQEFRDPWFIPAEWIDGRVRARVPQAYAVIYVARNPIFLAAMAGLLITLALWPRDPLSDPPTGPAIPDLAPPED